MNPVGSLNLTVTSPAQAFTEPLSLAQVKEFLNLPERSPADSEEDALLESMIVAARDIAEILQGRDLVEKQWDMSMDYFPCDYIYLNDPLVSVDLVRYRDTSGAMTVLVENTDYIVDTAKHPGVICPAYNRTWPTGSLWPSSAVLIRFTSGFSGGHSYWENEGQRVLTGMKQLISAWFNGRLPFEPGTKEGMLEYPFSVTANLSYGALPRIR